MGGGYLPTPQELSLREAVDTRGQVAPAGHVPFLERPDAVDRFLDGEWPPEAIAVVEEGRAR